MGTEVTIPDFRDILSDSELRKQFLSITANHYKAADLKGKGKSNQHIAKTLSQNGEKITELDVQRMLDKLLALNYMLVPKASEILKQQLGEQLDSLIDDMYKCAKAEDREFLRPNEAKQVLAILDKKSKIHGLDAAVEVKVSNSAEVQRIQQALYQKLDNIMQKPTVIEVVKNV